PRGATCRGRRTRGPPTTRTAASPARAPSGGYRHAARPATSGRDARAGRSSSTIPHERPVSRVRRVQLDEELAPLHPLQEHDPPRAVAALLDPDDAVAPVQLARLLPDQVAQLGVATVLALPAQTHPPGRARRARVT